MSDLATAVAAIIRQVLLHVDADVKSGIAQVIAGSARRRLPPRRRRGGRHLIAERVTAAQDIAISRDEAAVILLDMAEAPRNPSYLRSNSQSGASNGSFLQVGLIGWMRGCAIPRRKYAIVPASQQWQRARVIPEPDRNPVVICELQPCAGSAVLSERAGLSFPNTMGARIGRASTPSDRCAPRTKGYAGCLASRGGLPAEAAGGPRPGERKTVAEKVATQASSRSKPAASINAISRRGAPSLVIWMDTLPSLRRRNSKWPSRSI